jgi:hypothetical protein
LLLAPSQPLLATGRRDRLSGQLFWLTFRSFGRGGRRPWAQNIRTCGLLIVVVLATFQWSAREATYSASFAPCFSCLAALSGQAPSRACFRAIFNHALATLLRSTPSVGQKQMGLMRTKPEYSTPPSPDRSPTSFCRRYLQILIKGNRSFEQRSHHFLPPPWASSSREREFLVNPGPCELPAG